MSSDDSGKQSKRKPDGDGKLGDGKPGSGKSAKAKPAAKKAAKKAAKPASRKRPARETAAPASAPSSAATPPAVRSERQESAVDNVLFTAAIVVRWRDLDAFNHVNNSTFLTYLEEARLQWLRHVPGTWFDAHSMPVLAACTLNYIRPIAWPATVHVQLGCQRLGNSSLTISHRIIDADDSGCLYSDGHVVMVWMDPASGSPVDLPHAIRDAVSGAAGAPA